MDNSISRFWVNYIYKTNTYDVPMHARRWYVRHVEVFIKTFPETRLAAISVDNLAGYLEGLGRKLDCHDWQLRWVVDALPAERGNDVFYILSVFIRVHLWIINYRVGTKNVTTLQKFIT